MINARSTTQSTTRSGRTQDREEEEGEEEHDPRRRRRPRRRMGPRSSTSRGSKTARGRDAAARSPHAARAAAPAARDADHRPRIARVRWWRCACGAHGHCSARATPRRSCTRRSDDGGATSAGRGATQALPTCSRSVRRNELAGAGVETADGRSSDGARRRSRRLRERGAAKRFLARVAGRRGEGRGTPKARGRRSGRDEDLRADRRALNGGGDTAAPRS